MENRDHVIVIKAALSIVAILVMLGFVFYPAEKREAKEVVAATPKYLEFCVVSGKDFAPAGLMVEKQNCPVGSVIMRAEIIGTTTLSVSK